MVQVLSAIAIVLLVAATAVWLVQDIKGEMKRLREAADGER